MINKNFILISILVILLSSMPAFCFGNNPNVSSAEDEAKKYLQAYLQIDTTNPPGHEKRAAEFFKSIFDKEGIECEIFDQGNDRANVIARLRGNGHKRPIILLNHLDVVPADASRWTVPPFSGEIRDGYIWGRGALDMKATAVCQLMTMLSLKRSGKVLDRDILFWGSVDEEEGTDNGVVWMIAHHKDKLLNAEYVLTEGNNILLENGKTKAWNVDVTEKSVLWLKMIAFGKAGHASIPEKEGAVAKIVQASKKILEYNTPVRLLPSVDYYFRQLAKSSSPELKAILSDPATSLKDPILSQQLLNDPYRNAYLRSTISITGLTGSTKVNVIPGEATALLDCRLLPGDDPDKFLETLKKIVQDETIKFEVLSSGHANESPINTDLYKAIERARDHFDPGVAVLTPPLTSTTDASSLREIGMVVYGFEPFRIASDEDLSHGDNERISLDNLSLGLKVTYMIVSDVCGSGN